LIQVQPEAKRRREGEKSVRKNKKIKIKLGFRRGGAAVPVDQPPSETGFPSRNLHRRIHVLQIEREHREREQEKREKCL